MITVRTCSSLFAIGLVLVALCGTQLFAYPHGQPAPVPTHNLENVSIAFDGALVAVFDAAASVAPAPVSSAADPAVRQSQYDHKAMVAGLFRPILNNSTATTSARLRPGVARYIGSSGAGGLPR